MKEIERRFHVQTIPELSFKQDIWQLYLINTDNVTVRLRAINGRKYYLTVKTSTDQKLVRDEFEIELTNDQFFNLLPAIPRQSIVKTRYTISHNPIVVVDDFHENLTGLRIAEVEFDSEELAHEFIVPEWFGTEITDDSRFTNAALARLDEAEINELLSNDVPYLT